MPHTSIDHGHLQERLVFIQNNRNANSNPYIFENVIDDEIHNVIRIQLVSMCMNYHNAYVHASIAFNDIQTTWPLFAETGNESPMSITDARYTQVFTPPLPRLSKIRVHLYNAAGRTVRPEDHNVLIDEDTYNILNPPATSEVHFTDEPRTSLIFRVSYLPTVIGAFPPAFEKALVTPSTQTSFWVLDNRYSENPREFQFRVPDAFSTYSNITRISLAHMIVSRRVTPEPWTQHPYVWLRFHELSKDLPIFFKYQQYGTYLPYESMAIDPSVLDMNFNPPLSKFQGGRLTVSVLDHNKNLVDHPQDRVVIVLLQVEYIPRIEVYDLANLYQRHQRELLLVDNRKFPTSPYDFVYELPIPLRGVSSLSLINMTFPSSVRSETEIPDPNIPGDTRTAHNWEYFIEVEISNLDISWKVPYRLWGYKEHPNAMVTSRGMHTQIFKVPVNIRQLRIRFLTYNDTPSQPRKLYTYPPFLAASYPEPPACLLIEAVHEKTSNVSI